MQEIGQDYIFEGAVTDLSLWPVNVSEIKSLYMDTKSRQMIEID